MKRWTVIHKIKSLHDEGRGLSIRAISKELGIARNSVRKYLRAGEEEIAQQIGDPARAKLLDDYRDYLIQQLKSFPRLSAVKLARRLADKLGELPCSERTFRRYVQDLKNEVATGQLRYYEPVVDNLPGVQCQVDAGELREVNIGGTSVAVHFVVFVLAYSRLMYVGLSLRPLDTEKFIELHDEALRYFGGRPEECVYDQTKLVVIHEKYRELTLNDRFHQYATAAGFRIHACQGYDPQSKGKVEAGVKYVKQDCLYGETFTDEADLRQHVLEWLDGVANVRTHGTTGETPREHFERDERKHLKSYLTPSPTAAASWETRKADKTGLISWKSNKYSVPMVWQQNRVGVRESGGRLHILDPGNGEVIASHDICVGQGRLSKHKSHYRDHEIQIGQLESEIQGLVGDVTIAENLCAQIRKTLPKVYKDQLYALRNMLRKAHPVDQGLLREISTWSGMTATRVEEHLMAARAAIRRERTEEPIQANPEPHLDLSAYQHLGQQAKKGVWHEHA